MSIKPVIDCYHAQTVPSRYVRLTSDRGSQAGWIFSRLPLTATNWEVSILRGTHDMVG